LNYHVMSTRGAPAFAHAVAAQGAGRRTTGGGAGGGDERAQGKGQAIQPAGRPGEDGDGRRCTAPELERRLVIALSFCQRQSECLRLRCGVVS